MSETMTPRPKRSTGEFLSLTPDFKMDGLLPQAPGDVLFNYRKQQQAFDPFEQQAMDAAYAAGWAYAGRPCMQIVTITLCFDGTNNHEPTDSLALPSTTTNVARLFHASLGGSEHEAEQREGFYRYYMQGVGTEFKEIGEFKPDSQGLTMSTGGENRINWGLTRLIDALKKACHQKPPTMSESYALVQKMGTSLTEDMLAASIFKNSYTRRKEVLAQPLAELKAQIDAAHAGKTIAEIKAIRLFVYGFSRGAAQARAFANWLEALTKVEVKGTTCYLFAGLPIKIVFMGLFDTVASVGIPYLAPFAAGHLGWADGTLRLSDSEDFLERCVHMVAAHEQRSCFPLDSIRRQANPDDPNCPSTYRNGTAEYLYPGMHSDVGGGYPPGDQGKAAAGGKEVLSQIALHHMYDEAYKVGAPLQAPPEAFNMALKHDRPWLVMSDSTSIEFQVAPTLIERFNTWLDNMDNGPLEEVMAREAGLITGWRISRYAMDRINWTNIYRRVLQNGPASDMDGDEVDAFIALHARQLEEDAAMRAGSQAPVWSEAELASQKKHQATKVAYAKRTGTQPADSFNTSKMYEPNLDYRQLRNAMADFRRDYVPEWNLTFSEMISLGTLFNTLVGGLVYMTNGQDEAEHYAELRQAGEANYALLFGANGKPVNDKAWAIVDLFDEHVHDSRAWFMNAALNEREVFSDYFRYRGIFFDTQSNNELSLLVNAGRVVGVALAVASVGLTIRRQDPRFLVGLILPSLGTPVLRGKVGFPQISAFDTVTGLALPMIEGIEAVCAFTKNTGDAVKAAQALPVPPALTEKTATTADLIAILKASQALETNSLLEQALQTQTPQAEPTKGWLDQARGMAQSLKG
ncbi:T6SS phospholipase effector Tle1-like catalytic domain-containing protein [Pseudomonas psychrophila]|uniref:Uncharacterized alpha/beta hydrolase domain n=1 Tax=Pseudomonas psychrophila TaxID=122355 RepID=A0ABY0W2K6_9PSED|nr:DUF2235 domain-containing protein [Pseudomonas psychrophila]KAB0491393.1 DUF2235 domain-containing protein [Pseudomonas psychrophila]KMN00509.1 hypothetical protein TU76_09545 [Pseudomonas psychrophila]QIE34239.1 DUF2235 domain-containing protein [Pseudomonas psychrophila]WVI96336.1 DUF2235 domain-containing protein [Pseudomonas psychrophila]SDU70349.1 Uncharacterized alpha/beta hydrolase domain [Pseudomonas psychrophila]